MPSNGLGHEAVTEAKQGSAISITVEVGSELQFDKLVLAYRPDGAEEFLGREMKQVSDGQYGAEIPPTATAGSVVGYYIEAEDADGAPVAARGSVDNPLVIHLAGVGARHHEAEGDEDEDEEEPDNRYYVGLMAGMGLGWATGNGDTNHDISIDPSGLAPAGLAQISPEVGYWWNSDLLLSVQIRYEVVTGTNDIYCMGQTAGSCAMNPNAVYKTANYALAISAGRPGSSSRTETSTPSSRWPPAGGPSATPSISTAPPTATSAGLRTWRPARTPSGAGPCCSAPARGSCTSSAIAPPWWRSSTRRSASRPSRSTSTPTSASPSGPSRSAPTGAECDYYFFQVTANPRFAREPLAAARC